MKKLGLILLLGVFVISLYVVFFSGGQDKEEEIFILSPDTTVAEMKVRAEKIYGKRIKELRPAKESMLIEDAWAKGHLFFLDDSGYLPKSYVLFSIDKGDGEPKIQYSPKGDTTDIRMYTLEYHFPLKIEEYHFYIEWRDGLPFLGIYAPPEKG
jgi:hypothetical protein